MKKIILSIFLLSFIATFAFSQDHAVDKGAFILAGTGSFISQGGDLYEDFEENRLSTFTLTSTVNYFVVHNVFIGAGLSYNRMAQGDFSMSTIGIGPTVGYAFGKTESKSNPYIAGSIQLYSLGTDGDTTSGTDISINAGIIISIKEHLGLIIEIGYHFQNLKNEAWPESMSGNIFSIGIGIAGLLF
ncbi:MAG: hypothetical protein JSV46_01280 [Candidatus Aminicenantes bacterium]|nr:MAG: hypothetical protein JSV46_01280 [Candidatus Aminicenantes bacterium]